MVIEWVGSGPRNYAQNMALAHIWSMVNAIEKVTLALTSQRPKNGFHLIQRKSTCLQRD
jgi:hypothetical protein